MKRFLINISNSHDKIFKGILIVLTIWVVASMMPHKVRYKFDFRKGKVWNYNDLIAPMDFAVYKDPDSLAAEKERVAATVLPHYRTDTSVAEHYLKELIAEHKVPESGIRNLERCLNDLYAKGVFKNNGSDGISFILVSGKETVASDASSFLSPSEAAYELRKRMIGSGFEDLIPDNLPANIIYDEQLTAQVRQEQIQDILPTRGMVHQGDIIISRGQSVNDERFLVLQSLKKATDFSDPDPSVSRRIFWSQIVLVSVALSMLLVFLGLLRKDIFADNRKMSLILMLIAINVAMYTAILKSESLNLYVAPLCIMPIVIRVFFDTRLALFAHVVTTLMLGFVAPGGYEFIFMQVIAGMVTIFSVTNMRRRAQLFISAGFVLLSYIVTYSALSVLYKGSYESIELMDLYWLTGNVLLTLFSYPLIFIFEKLFGLTSDVSLMELSDTNSPLLRELSIKAPGTFQHSMQVANLAEAATYRIGGNSLLVRAGALYHDVGKMDAPLYFIENQTSGINPHDDLSFEESASIIIGHVIGGIEIARKNKLPDLIIDFIRTHHGTSMVQYFYQSFLKNFPMEIVDEEDFRYPGPLPFSKETAVLMMADSVEAASRSLTVHTPDTINGIVDKVIDSQIEAQQFINCDITFKDISTIKKIFKKMLMSIYHVRVEYPTA